MKQGASSAAALLTGDIEIGAVEIKNSTDDTRATVGANGLHVDVRAIQAGDNNIGNVDVVTLPALPAGTNAIGKLAANSGVDIGDVDVTSIAAGSNIIGHTRSLGGASATNLSADTAVKSGAGNLVGIFVASSTAGTIKLWDNTSATGTVLVNTFSATAATWYPLPFAFGTGLYVDVGGTIDLTVSYT